MTDDAGKARLQAEVEQLQRDLEHTRQIVAEVHRAVSYPKANATAALHRVRELVGGTASDVTAQHSAQCYIEDDGDWVCLCGRLDAADAPAASTGEEQ